MMGGRLFGFFLILGLLLSALTPSQGMNPGEIINSTYSGSILNMGRVFQQTSSHSGIILNWPLMFIIIYNNPPGKPVKPLGNASGTPGTNYCYYTSAIDPDGDRVQYLIDWGDGTASIIGLIESGTMGSANHSWSEPGIYQVKANAKDNKGATSEWSESLNITIDAPPNNPSMPYGPRSGKPEIHHTYAVSAIDPDGDQIRFTFDWGDGTASTIGPVDSGTKANASHSWSKSATYQIRANATDSFGKSSGWSEPLTVTLNIPPNSPSMPSGPNSGRPGILYTYSASAADPDGDEIEITFDWGDSTTSIVGPVDSGAVAEAVHTWIQAGSYQVKANAADSKGAPSEWSKSWMVTMNAPPDNPSTPSGSQLVYAWTSNSYSTYAADPNDDLVKCIFDWGDGNTSTTDLIKSGSNTSAQHIWNIEGTYQIKAIAIDSIGDASGWSDFLTVTVIANNRPKVPIDIFGPNFGYIGIDHSYFTLANDPDNDKVKYTFDWGDGTASMTDLLDSGSVESASHNWNKAGIYQVKCNATDSKGVSSIWSKPFNVTIADNDPPNAPLTPLGPTSGRSLTAYKYATSAEDPNGNHMRYVFDWGDGTTSWTGLDFINSGTSKSVFHKWSKSGTYQVKAMAMDDKGAISGWSNALTVNIS